MTNTRRDDLRLKPLKDLIMGEWDDTAEQNKVAVGDGWHVAETFVGLHVQALKGISRAAGRHPSESDKAVIQLGTHGINLYLTTPGLTCRGLFDVVSHLMRGMLDCQSLLYATAKDATLASKFASGKLEASHARKLWVADLRTLSQNQLAQDIDRILLADAKAASELSHVNILHGLLVLEQQGDSMMPMVGGRPDDEQSISFFRVANLQESHALGWFEAFRRPALSKAWISDFDTARQSFSQWMKTSQT